MSGMTARTFAAISSCLLKFCFGDKGSNIAEAGLDLMILLTLLLRVLRVHVCHVPPWIILYYFYLLFVIVIIILKSFFV